MHRDVNKFSFGGFIHICEWRSIWCRGQKTVWYKRFWIAECGACRGTTFARKKGRSHYQYFIFVWMWRVAIKCEGHFGPDFFQVATGLFEILVILILNPFGIFQGNDHSPCTSIRRRYSDGLSPLCFLNKRLRWLSSVKFSSETISLIRISLCPSLVSTSFNL